MKRIAVFAVAALGLAAGSMFALTDARSAPESATWTADPVHSFVLFRIKHMEASYAFGRFNEFTATVEADDAGTELKGVTFNVKTASVDTGNEKRDGHLKSPDFFNAKQFEDITFKSTSVKSTGAGVWDVTGDLTLHGVTKSITAKVEKVGASEFKGATLLGFESSFVIKRTDFGMTNAVGLPGVGDEVTMRVAVETTKK